MIVSRSIHAAAHGIISIFFMTEYPPVLLPGKSHGRRSLVGCSPWGREESDMTKRLHFHFSLSCTGEEIATHSSILAWRIPGMGEPGGLPSMGSHRIGCDWSDLAAVFYCEKIPHLYDLICLWTFRLLPCVSCCKQWKLFCCCRCYFKWNLRQ